MKSELVRFYEGLRAAMTEHGVHRTPEHRRRFMKTVSDRSGVPPERVEELALRLGRLINEAQTEPGLRVILADKAKEATP